MASEKNQPMHLTVFVCLTGSGCITICQTINGNQDTDTFDGLMTHIMSGCRVVIRARMSLLNRGMVENSRIKCGPITSNNPEGWEERVIVCSFVHLDKSSLPWHSQNSIVISPLAYMRKLYTQLLFPLRILAYSAFDTKYTVTLHCVVMLYRTVYLSSIAQPVVSDQTHVNSALVLCILFPAAINAKSI